MRCNKIYSTAGNQKSQLLWTPPCKWSAAQNVAIKIDPNY